MAETCHFLFCPHKSIQCLKNYTKLDLHSTNHTQACPSGFTQNNSQKINESHSNRDMGFCQKVHHFLQASDLQVRFLAFDWYCSKLLKKYWFIKNQVLFFKLWPKWLKRHMLAFILPFLNHKSKCHFSNGIWL